MKSYVALIWIVLAIIMFVYLIYHNIKMTKVLRTVLELTESSKERCEALLGRMEDAQSAKERRDILKELNMEERKMRELFSKEKEWPGQGKRIREHLKMIKDYRIEAKETAERNKNHV